MRRALTIALAIAAADVSFSYVAARSLRSEPVDAVGLRPVSEIVAAVREMGLAPNTQVLRRGAYYVLHALDPRGVELRVVADAHFGDILSVRPARPYSRVPNYVRGPRIIHVPQPDDEPAETYDGRGSAALGDHDVAPARAAAPPRRPVRPRARHRADEPPPPPPVRRKVLSAPPPDAALSPIHPTPNYDDNPAEKFTAPSAAAPATAPKETAAETPAGTPSASATIPPPPVGYTPPSALPKTE